MIQDPALLALVLVGLVALILWAKEQAFARPAFRFLPVPFWCYFLPMAASSAGLLPADSRLYPFLSKYLVAVCLPFLLINVDLPGLAALGARSLALMASGCAGIMAGAVAGFGLLSGRLPDEAWKSAGALSASWTGGSANMAAVKEALSAPEAVFAPVVVVDAFFAYGWMALLILFAGFQNRFDRWNRVDAAALEKLEASARPPRRGIRRLPWPAIPAVCAGLGLLAVRAAERLPPLGAVVSAATWRVLLVTTASLVLSLTGLFSERAERTERWGLFLLYVLLASLGAQASLIAIWKTPLFLALGFIMLSVHALVLFAAARILRAPLSLVAAASQACVGGAVSAPMVAAVYRPALAPVGLLLAVSGNVAGTYLGLGVAAACRALSR